MPRILSRANLVGGSPSYGGSKITEIQISPPAGDHAAARFLRFTPRDLDILRHVSEGCTNVQIASRLHISKYTVAQHIAKMLRQAGASNRTDLVSRAHIAGLL